VLEDHESLDLFEARDTNNPCKESIDFGQLMVVLGSNSSGNPLITQNGIRFARKYRGVLVIRLNKWHPI